MIETSRLWFAAAGGAAFCGERSLSLYCSLLASLTDWFDPETSREEGRPGWPFGGEGVFPEPSLPFNPIRFCFSSLWIALKASS